MGNHGRRMATKQAKAEQRQRRAKLVAGLAVVVIVIVTIAVLADANPTQSQPQAVDFFAGLTPLTEAEELAGWSVDVTTSSSLLRWTNLSDEMLVQALRRELSHLPRVQKVDWLRRMQLPPLQTVAVGERRAVIVGQAHVIRDPLTRQADLNAEASICQKQIYRFLLQQGPVQPDMTLLHEGVSPAHAVVTGTESVLGPYIASIQYALRHGVEQLPSEDDQLIDLDDFLGDYPGEEVSFDTYPDYRQIITELRSRVMARQMVLVLNRGRTPYLVVGSMHEYGVAKALTDAGYAVVFWRAPVLRK